MQVGVQGDDLMHTISAFKKFDVKRSGGSNADTRRFGRKNRNREGVAGPALRRLAHRCRLPRLVPLHRHPRQLTLQRLEKHIVVAQNSLCGI